MRLVLMGTGSFAAPTFAWLIRSEHEVLGLVTRPVRAAATRDRPAASPIRALAEEHRLSVFAPEDVNSDEGVGLLSGLRPDLLVVCDYGQILSAAVLATAKVGGINLHGSLLPKYRGAAPVNWALWNGETQTGVTVIHMTPKLDAGPCLARQATAIGDDEDAVELEARLARLGVESVREAIRLLAGWDGVSPLGEPQDPRLSSQAPRLKKADGEVDWSRTARQIRNQVRAFKPWPGTYTHDTSRSGPPLRLILDRVAADERQQQADQTPGSVVCSDGKRLLVATGLGILSIERIQPAGKKPMDIARFLNGYAIHEGTRLGRPAG